MDMACPLPITIEGHKYILAICDHFTKHIKVLPMKTQTALEVAEKCLDYCLTFGIPESVLTDQGSNFTSQSLSSTCFTRFSWPSKSSENMMMSSK